MAETDSNAQVPIESPCRHCRLLISTGAALCYKCGNYQNWRRYLSFSTSILALLVALLSVASTALPAIVKSLDRPTSNLIATNVIGTKDVVKITVSNLGPMPGIVKGGHIELGSIEKNGELWASAKLEGDGLGFLIAGGAIQLTFRTEYNYTTQSTERLYDAIAQSNILNLYNKRSRDIFAFGAFTYSFKNQEEVLRVPLSAQLVLSGLLNHYRKCRRSIPSETCWNEGKAQLKQATALLRPYGGTRANLTPLSSIYEQEEASRKMKHSSGLTEAPNS